MPPAANITFLSGLLVLILSIVNWISSQAITPELQRSEILSCMSGVGLMLIALLWTEILPAKAKKRDLEGNQGIKINDDIQLYLKEELAWGSQLILTATPASTILIWWNGKTILHRGILGSGNFIPGEITKDAMNKDKKIVLLKTSLYPGSFEFDPVCRNLPSIIVVPLTNKGVVIVGGWSERCFSRSDEKWIEGWSKKLFAPLEEN